jgi:hypothetical protein
MLHFRTDSFELSLDIVAILRWVTAVIVLVS